MSAYVLYFAHGNLAAIAILEPWLIPDIAARKPFSLAGSAYSFEKGSESLASLISFCGNPVRKASVRSPQNRYSRTLAISRMPPT
jgi:hypothetical protein